jgi:hypothetical protein
MVKISLCFTVPGFVYNQDKRIYISTLIKIGKIFLINYEILKGCVKSRILHCNVSSFMRICATKEVILIDNLLIFISSLTHYCII